MNTSGRGAMRAMLALGSAMAMLPTAAWAQQAATGGEAPETIIVTGSRIPRVQEEGPAPITVITSDTIRDSGYASVPDILRAVTQNGGETQSQQSFSGAAFTPGAQQVDLRGLGPNHTLVLVNGRRIADFPLPFQGRSNFTDISNIPVSLIERVEVLSGSASAIYGSDAIAGVINFTLKKHADGLTLDYRHGDTQHGGGDSHRFTAAGGWEKGDFHIVGGLEYQLQRPLWAYQRGIQNSRADNPTTAQPLAGRTFLRYNPDADEYVDPGKATCDRLGYLNGGSTYYASRPRYGAYDPVLDDYGPGYFCGSDTSVGYGTVISRREGFNGYLSAGLDLSDKASLFVDAQFGISKVSLMRDVMKWYFQDATGSSDSTFYNAFDGTLDDWSRQFTPEESGRFGSVMTHNRQQTFSVTPGIKGTLGKWSYEASFNHSEYSARVDFPEVIAAKANALYLGAQQGVDADSGYPIYNADPARLYTPLTRAEYDSITAYSTYRPKSWNDGFSATVNTSDLFQLPAGPVGFAAVAELGKQGYALKPDPLALTNYYVGLKDSDGYGTRTHWALGGELRVPVAHFLELSGAARYDHFSFAGNSIGKLTYNAGAELRPMRSLLLRAAYGTGFRAPDLHYVFTGPGNTHPSATDYYLCRTEEPDTDIGDCSYADSGIVANRTGNKKLQPETSKSLNAGIVFAPTRHIDISVDYFRVQLDNQVADLSIDKLLRDEASCRIGTTSAGTAVDPTSPTCLDAIARIHRYTGGAFAGQVSSVAINPINVAQERTSGVDVALHVNVPTERLGTFALALSHTHVFDHTYQQYPGDPVINKLAFDSGYDIPRDKSTASLTWSQDKLKWTIEGRRLGKLPNYDEDAFIKESYQFNTTFQIDFNDHLRGSLSIDNLFDQDPVRDPTYASYPYYDISWFDSVGRSFYLQLTWKLGGKAL